MRHSTTLVPSYPPSVDNPTLGNINLTINENLLSDHDPHVQSTTTVQNMSHMYGTPFQAKWRRHGFRTIENMVDHCNTRGVFMDFFFRGKRIYGTVGPKCFKRTFSTKRESGTVTLSHTNSVR